MKKKYCVVFLWLFAVLSGCAAGRVAESPSLQNQTSHPVVNIAESRSMYIYSLSRIHVLDGDLDPVIQSCVDADEAAQLAST